MRTGCGRVALRKKVVGFIAAAGVILGAHGADKTSYTYDVLGRLTHAQSYRGTQTTGEQSFQYDPSGNRTGMQVVVTSNLPPSTITPPASGRVNSTSNSGALLVVNVGAAGATGSMTFYVNDVLVETVLVSNGQARVVLRGFTSGTYTVRATYSGDANNGAATKTFTIRIQDLSWLPAVLDLLLQ